MTDLELKLQEDIVKLKGVIIEQSKIILEYQKLLAKIQEQEGLTLASTSPS